MYLGNGQVVHAPRPGKSVEITSLSSGFSVDARVSWLTPHESGPRHRRGRSVVAATSRCDEERLDVS